MSIQIVKYMKNKLKNSKLSHGVNTGLLLIGLSFLSFLPVGVVGHNKIFLGALFYAGIISVSEAITRSFASQSLLRSVRESRTTIVRFLIATTIAAVLLDGVVKALGKLWVYPDWSFSFYLVIFIPGFALYWLTLAESYLAVKTLLDYFRKGTKRVERYFLYERHFFVTLFFVGVGMLAYSVQHIYLSFQQQVNPLFKVSYVSDHSELFVISFVDVLLIFFGTWFVFEFIEYLLRKKSLFHDMLRGYYNPLIAIFVSGWVVSVLMEVQNIPMQLWTYTNWPLSEFGFFGIPLLVFVTWPLHYIAFLSLFRIITDEQSDVIWRGDQI